MLILDFLSHISSFFVLPVTTCSSGRLSVLRLNIKSPSARDKAKLPNFQIINSSGFLIPLTIDTIKFYPTTSSCYSFSFIIIIWFMINRKYFNISIDRCYCSTITDITLQRNTSFERRKKKNFCFLFTQKSFWSLTITQIAVVPAKSSRISSSKDISLSNSI